MKYNLKGDIDKEFEMQSLASFPYSNIEHYSAIYLRILKCHASTKTFHKRTDREEKE